MSPKDTVQQHLSYTYIKVNTTRRIIMRHRETNNTPKITWKEVIKIVKHKERALDRRKDAAVH